MVTCDSAGASHDLIAHLDKLASRPGHQLIYSVGWDLGKREKDAITAVPEQAWQIAVDHRGEVRERRAEDACTDCGCTHRKCWIEEAHVTELTAPARTHPRLARPARLHRRRPQGACTSRGCHSHRERHRDRKVPQPPAGP